MKRSIAVLALVVASCASLATRADAQQGHIPHAGPRAGQPAHPGQPGQHTPEHDVMMQHLFPPELVMRHQGAIDLSDAQRTALSATIQQAQSKVVDVQWKLSGEGEKLARLLQNATVDEVQLLAQVDRILALEREVKRAHLGMMARIKNTLTAAQQEKLRALRAEQDGRRQ